MTTALFLLRCTQMGLSMADLDVLTIGLVLDMITERSNDEHMDEYARTATQADFDMF